eukprot:1156552-Pelagomonas_calceolata.AAC.1
MCVCVCVCVRVRFEHQHGLLAEGAFHHTSRLPSKNPLMRAIRHHPPSLTSVFIQGDALQSAFLSVHCRFGLCLYSLMLLKAARKGLIVRELDATLERGHARLEMPGLTSGPRRAFCDAAITIRAVNMQQECMINSHP